MGMCAPGSTVWLSKSTNPKRKLAWSWELIEVEQTLIGVHTGRPNTLVGSAIEAGEIPELGGYDAIRREVKYGQNSRIDLLLEKTGETAAYVEIKSVTLSRTPGLAEFPDSKTTRGAKHMDELAEMARAGHRAVVFFLIQRTDCTRMRPATDIDPIYTQRLKAATKAGVEVICYSCKVTPEQIDIDQPISFCLS